MEIAEIKQTLWIQVPPKKILYPPKMYPFRVAADPWIAREREQSDTYSCTTGMSMVLIHWIITPI